MGLFDWLTDGLGNMGASASPGTMPPDMPPPPPPPAPPQDPTADAPAPPISGPNNNDLLPFSQGGDPMAGAGSGNNGGLPAPGPAAPMPPPPPAPPPPPGPAALPPNAAPTSGVVPPGAPMSLAPPVGQFNMPGPNGDLNGPTSALGRALGLDSNREKSFFGSLGGGLTAVGNAKGKSKGAAFASGAGGAIEGGTKAEDKGYDQRLKSLQLAVAAQSAGDRATAQLELAKYHTASLKAQSDRTKGGGAWNKPDSQKFIDGKRSVANDPEVDTAAKQLQKMSPSNPQYAAAQAQLQALIQKKEQQTFAVMGLRPETIAAMNGQPPGTRENPHQLAPQSTQKDFDLYVKPGDVYINPRDHKPYVRDGGGDGAGDSTAETAPSTPPDLPGEKPVQSGVSDDEREDL